MKLLIVDDEEEIVDSIYHILKSNLPQYEYIKTSLSRQAREILRTDIIDILLTDIKMPNWNGFELAETAKKTNPNCRVLLLTGYNDFDYAYQAIKTKCDDFILKNNLDEEIINAVKKCAAGVEAERAHAEEELDKLARPQGEYRDNIEFVKQYIQDHIDRDVSLNKLSQAVYLNPTYLSRLFKNVTGTTITEYLLQVRVETAKKLLLKPGKKVQDVALAVGIDSPIYFARIFKKSTGYTPQEYRSLFYGSDGSSR